MTRSLALLAALTLLTACAPPKAPTLPAPVAEAPVIAEPAPVEAAVIAPRTCDGTGDGIGGTGCPKP